MKKLNKSFLKIILLLLTFTSTTSGAITSYKHTGFTSEPIQLTKGACKSFPMCKRPVQ